MKKRAISIVLVIMLAIAFAVPALAASSYRLHQGVGPFDWKDYSQGADFGISVKKGEDKFVPGFELGTEGTVLWHFVNPDKLGGYANIIFLDADGQEVIFSNVKSYKNNQHFAVVTLQSWKLLSAEYFPEKAPGKKGTKFNLSHTAGMEQYGALKVSVDVQKQHDEVTWQHYYERDVQKFYERDVQDFYQRDVQKFYERHVQDFYQRRSYDRYVPVFAKEISNNTTSTLTSSLYGNEGGTFNNGMVWLKINVEEAISNGYTIGIAQSDPGNTYIGYDYNVKIEDDKLIIFFDDRFIGTQITAKVYDSPPKKHDNSGHESLKAGETYVVDLPDNYGGDVYLYVHLADGISWYTTGEYEFVEWRYKDTIVSDYIVVNTEYGEYELIKTEIGEYKLMYTEKGEYRLIDTTYGDYDLIETKEINRKTVVDDYDVEFDLSIENADGDLVYRGKIQNNSEIVIPNLVPGNYTAILSGDDIAEQIKYADIIVSQTTEVNFNDIPSIVGDQVNIYLGDVKTDKELEADYRDNVLDADYSDNILDDVREDNKLDDVYLPDKILPDEKLGNETNPYDENAIRLN